MSVRKTHCKNGHLRLPDTVDKNGTCKVCRNDRSRKWREANREKMREHCRRWSAKNRDYNIERGRRYRKEQPRNVLNTRLKSRYGITLADVVKMLEQQNHRCAICCRPFSKTNSYHVDHNHRTNKVRALLCHKCNSAIGYFSEDLHVLENAVVYLALHNIGYKKEA